MHMQNNWPETDEVVTLLATFLSLLVSRCGKDYLMMVVVPSLSFIQFLVRKHQVVGSLYGLTGLCLVHGCFATSDCDIFW